MKARWIDVQEELPEDDQRVLGYIPDNKVFLPGRGLEFELREVVVLRFCLNFYQDKPDKLKKHGLHFWAGEGNSNHFFNDVTHWCPMPSGPEGEP